MRAEFECGEELYEKIKKSAEEEDIHTSELITKILETWHKEDEEHDVSDIPPVKMPHKVIASLEEKHSLNDCAEALIGHLDEQSRDFAIECANIILKIPMWQLVVGHLRQVADRGEMQSPWLDSDWGKDPVKLENINCLTCGNPFSPIRLGQSYCCNGCGSNIGRHTKGCLAGEYVEPEPVVFSEVTEENKVEKESEIEDMFIYDGNWKRS